MNLRFQRGVNIPELDCALVPQFLVVLTADVNIMEQHQCLNELLYAVNSVALRHVDCVKQRNHDFKCP